MSRFTFKSGWALMVGLFAVAVTAPAQDIPRGGQLKCANNLDPSEVTNVTATLTWKQSGTWVGTQTFSCQPGTANEQDSQTVLQPAVADGWELLIEMTGPVVTYFACLPDVGLFDMGGMPHIRLRCTSPVGGAATFSLSRNP
jgi:hypothetical protein